MSLSIGASILESHTSYTDQTATMHSPNSAKPSLIRRIKSIGGLDFHVFVTLLSRGWTVLAGATTVVLLPLFLDPTQQGYYYTITSLLGLQILFELGLGQVIIQLVGHEVANLRVDISNKFEGDEVHVDRLASLMQLLRKWYIVAALLFTLSAGVGGAFFLGLGGHLPTANWLGPWATIIVCTALSLTCLPGLAMLEGCGKIGQVARLRMIQSIVGYGGLWLGLYVGAGLWAVVMVPLASAAMTTVWLRKVGAYKWLLHRAIDTANRIEWRRDVMPFQARIAISAMSGYFMFYAFTPLIFANIGPTEAGRFGIAMTVFNALSAVGTSWVYAKTPAMAMCIARGERQELDRIFAAVFKRSLYFTLVAAAAVVVCAWLLGKAQVPQISRIASTSVLLCLAFVCCCNCVVFSLAAYMRAHREEPMHGVSVAGAVATILVAFFGTRLGVVAMSAMYAAVTALLVLPWTVLLFLRYQRRS